MIIFAVRHADKLGGQGQDGLNDKGTARAKLLARMLAERTGGLRRLPRRAIRWR
jgi:hypothetical protein